MSFKLVFVALMVLSLSFAFVSAQVSIAPVLVEPQIPSVSIAPVLVEDTQVSIAPVLVEPQIPSVSIAPVLVEEEPNGNNNGGGNGGSGSNNNNDDSRRNPNILPLNELSTTPSEEQKLTDEESSTFSKITGAVTGVFGKTGTIGIAIFVVVLGVVGLIIYNRRSLGVVKSN